MPTKKSKTPNVEPLSELEKFIFSCDPQPSVNVVNKLVEQDRLIKALENKVRTLEAKVEEFATEREQIKDDIYEEAYARAENDIKLKFGLDDKHISAFLAGYVSRWRETDSKLEHLERQMRSTVKNLPNYGDDW